MENKEKKDQISDARCNVSVEAYPIQCESHTCAIHFHVFHWFFFPHSHWAHIAHCICKIYAHSHCRIYSFVHWMLNRHAKIANMNCNAIWMVVGTWNISPESVHRLSMHRHTRTSYVFAFCNYTISIYMYIVLVYVMRERMHARFKLNFWSLNGIYA